jgi:hypothetical protein
MHANRFVIAICTSVVVPLVIVPLEPGFGQRAGDSFSRAQRTPPGDPWKALVGRLDLEKYKATIKSLTQFGDRQQGTDRNRAAVDWIEAQLKSYGCTNTERIRYTYNAPPPRPRPIAATAPVTEIASGEVRAGVGGSRLRGMTQPVTPTTIPALSPIPRFALSTPSRRHQGRANRCIAPRSAPRTRTKCTSSEPTWTGAASARPRMTMVRARPWSWSWPASSMGPTCRRSDRSGSRSGTTSPFAIKPKSGL